MSTRPIPPSSCPPRDRGLSLYTKDLDVCVLCGTTGSTLPGKGLVRRPDRAWVCRDIAWCARQRQARKKAGER